LDEIGEELIGKIKTASKIEVQLKITADDFVPWKRSEDVFDGSVSFSPKTKGRMAEQIIAIGISTGGPPALLKLFSDFPENFPGAVLVVQHMPPGGFTHAFAERLDTASNLRVREAVNGDVPAAGCAYIAPGDFHLALRRESDGYVLRTEKTERISGHRPSIDVLFHSVAESAGNDSIGVIMTGMGRDGANGIKHLHDAGGYTIAQDRGSSVVYGMNRVAIEMDAIDEILQLDKITKKIVEYIRGIHKYRNSLVINHK
jgi:two-component system chemotaxis response regulator CheB